MAAPTTPAPDPWLLRGPAANRPAPVGAASQPQPRATLVAFAPAGTSASVFHGWLDAALAPLGVEVVPVELPGRAARIREPPIADMRQLME